MVVVSRGNLQPRAGRGSGRAGRPMRWCRLWHIELAHKLPTPDPVARGGLPWEPRDRFVRRTSVPVDGDLLHRQLVIIKKQ